MTITAAQLLVNVGANTLPAQTQITGLAGMLGAGGTLGIAAAAAGAIMVGVGVVATKMAGDFQAGLTSLVTGAGESQKNLSLVHDGILKLATDTGTSTKQLIDGMYMIESGGFHGAAGLKILQAAAEGAKVGNADLGVVADSVDTILKNFGENGALTATQATNALITTVANGKTHMNELADSLSHVLPAGASAGLGLKDVLGAMSTLTGLGLHAADSATYLRQMIISLEAPSDGAKKALRGIGISSDELAAHLHKGLPDALAFIRKQLDAHGIHEGSSAYVAALREISGGTRQMQGMLNLLGGEGTTQDHLKTFAANVAKIGGAAKATGDQVQGWSLVQKNMNQQFDRAKQVVIGLLIQLGEKLLPVVTKIAGWFADNLPGALKTFQANVAPVVKVVGDFIAAILHNKTVMGGLKDTFERLKPAIGPILTGLAILTAISFAPLAIAIGVFLGLAFVVTHLGDVLGWLGNRFGDLFGTIGAFVGNVAGAIGTWVGNMLGSAGHLRDEFVKRVTQMITNIVLAFVNFERGLIQKGHDIAANFIGTLQSLPGKMLQLGENLLKMLAQGLRNGRSAVVSAFSSIPGIGGMVSGLNNMIPKFASGGMMASAGLALVGEAGPELIHLPAGARVTPLPAGSGFNGAHGGSGNGTIHVHVDLDGREVARAAVKYAPTILRQTTASREF